MTTQFRTLILAGVAAAAAACAESAPTAPTAPNAAPAATAAGDVVGFAAPAPTVTCFISQIDQTDFQVTATWSGLSTVTVEFLNGTTVLAQEQLGRPMRSGNVTVTLQTEPTTLELIGKNSGVKSPCTTGA